MSARVAFLTEMAVLPTKAPCSSSGHKYSTALDGHRGRRDHGRMASGFREVDIAIVGAGPAGLMAAATAAQAGVSVELLDGADWAGGRLALQTQPLQGPASIYGGVSGVDFCARLTDDAVSAGVGLRLGRDVWEVRALGDSQPATSWRWPAVVGTSGCVRLSWCWPPGQWSRGSTCRGCRCRARRCPATCRRG